ncbi:MAG: glycoside hydrolase family 3 C-terminal domain-containing protein, partial [Bacteroidales bacterium]|nr:glycoside hydrolase family 3 C-terminal domain-containing protein [Bacteroidales bacterium]
VAADDGGGTTDDGGGTADDGVTDDGGGTADDGVTDDGDGTTDDGVTDDGGGTANGSRHSEAAANTRHTETADDTRHPEAAADTRHTEAANDTRHPETAADTRHPEAAADTRHPEAAADTRHPEASAGTRHTEAAADTRHPETAADTRHTEAAADTRHTEAANDTRHPEAAADTRHTRPDRVSVFVPQRWVPQTPGMFGLSMGAPGHWEYPVDRALVEKYYDWAETPDEADFALVVIQEPFPGSGYDVQDRARGGNGYVPISLQYRPYTAEYARTESVAGGDPKETFVNRSYKGKTVRVYNESDLDLVLKTRAEMGAKPVVVVVNVSRPVVLAEIEPLADAVLLSFKVQHQAVLDIVSGAAEPSGLLPMQLPADMRTVEEQCEDLPHDMRPLVDADGGVWDFAFGLNWAGEISDSRTEKYRIK